MKKKVIDIISETKSFKDEPREHFTSIVTL